MGCGASVVSEEGTSSLHTTPATRESGCTSTAHAEAGPDSTAEVAAPLNATAELAVHHLNSELNQSAIAEASRPLVDLAAPQPAAPRKIDVAEATDLSRGSLHPPAAISHAAALAQLKSSSFGSSPPAVSHNFELSQLSACLQQPPAECVRISFQQ
jgi:hypothetical protein